LGPERSGGVTWLCRKRARATAVLRASGEKSERPGGAIRSREKGEKERRLWPLYRRRHGEETAGELIELKRGVNHCAVTSPARNPVRGGRRLAGGSHLSVRGEGSRVPFRGRGVAGPGPLLELGRMVSPGALLYFYFFFPLFPFFCFLYFFIDFAF
jgi:hypothetical protein